MPSEATRPVRTVKAVSDASVPPFLHRTATDLPAELTTPSDGVAFLWIERGRVGCAGTRDAGFAVVPARTLVLLWCGAQRRWRRGRGPLKLQLLIVPYAWCVEREPGEALLRRLQRGECVVDRSSRLQSTLWAARWRTPGLATSPRRMRALGCELEARLLELGDEPGDESAGEPAATREPESRRKARRMARTIEERFPQTVSLRELAAGVALAPRYASSLFRACHGVTPLGYLNRLRTARARHLLATTDLKVIEVGLESGFTATSRFYAQFRRACGMAPAAYRAALRRTTEREHRASVARPQEAAPWGPASVRHVILWVDDNPNGNFEERKRLFGLGILCDSFVSNESAIAAYRTGRYELVVSDLNRPDGAEDGWALLRALREINPKAAVLLYTGRLHAEVERAARRRGAAGAFDRSAPLLAAIVRRLSGLAGATA